MRVRCSRIETLLPEYMEGVLPQEQEGRVAAHLQACAGCRAELELLRASLAVLDRVPAASPADDLWAGLQARLAAAEAAAPALPCRTAREQLPAYLEGELAAAEGAAVARHLAACAPCAAEEADYRHSFSLINELAPAAPPADLWARLEPRLQPQPSRLAWPLALRPWRLGGAVAGLAAAALALAAFWPRLAPVRQVQVRPGVTDPGAPVRMVEAQPAPPRHPDLVNQHPTPGNQTTGRPHANRSLQHSLRGIAPVRWTGRSEARAGNGRPARLKRGHPVGEPAPKWVPGDPPVVVISQTSPGELRDVAAMLKPTGESLSLAPDMKQLMGSGEGDNAPH
jgi:anti-sigma factor RsiW